MLAQGRIQGGGGGGGGGGSKGALDLPKIFSIPNRDTLIEQSL